MYFLSIWFKLPENLFPEFPLVAASTVHCSYICMFVSTMSVTLCTFVSSVGGKVWTSNNRLETYNNLEINYFPVIFKGFAKNISNYGSPEFWRTLFSEQKQSPKGVLLERSSQNI